MEAATSGKIIYDPLYGFIYLTSLEWEIIHSPFYQRLRWIKQLGFSFYVFPGAEHSRFGHSIGAMYNAHSILQSIGMAVSDKELFDSSPKSEKAMFHQSLRLAALLHDLGTFPFSHTTEMSYIKFGDTAQLKKGRDLADDHENLGSFIIKNTDYEGGITHILKKYGVDPQVISDWVKGVGKSLIGNQILHSEVDCDRMDYLLRDAHYTGLNYGTYDRSYLLHHFETSSIGDQQILSINKNAIHCVEDFLMSRFSWYSQVIRSTRGAKYDAIAEQVTSYLLENNLILKYSKLLEMIADNSEEFFKFNDFYFMSNLHRHYVDGVFDRDPAMKDMASCLIFERPCKALSHEDLKQKLLNQDEPQKNEKIIKKSFDLYHRAKSVLSKYGEKKDWIVSDIPDKNNIVFVKSKSRIVKGLDQSNILLTRDPVKISFGQGQVKLLAEVENSVISKLQNTYNFIPNIYCSNSAHEILKEHGVIG